MSPDPINKPPTAGPGGEGDSKHTASSTAGWNHLVKNLSYRIPTDLQNARKSRRALRILMTKGR